MAEVFGGVAALWQHKGKPGESGWCQPWPMSCWNKASSSLPPDCLLCEKNELLYWYMLQCKSGFRLLVATWFSTKLLSKKSVLTLFILSQKKKSLRASIPQTFIYFGCWQSFTCLTKLTHENVSCEAERPFMHVLDIWISSPMTFLCLALDHFLLYCLTFSYWLVGVNFQRAKQTELNSWGNLSLHLNTINHIKHN